MNEPTWTIERRNADGTWTWHDTIAADIAAEQTDDLEGDFRDYLSGIGATEGEWSVNDGINEVIVTLTEVSPQ